MSTVIMEERFKAEERKEILGEEWRKVSKIFDRYFSAYAFLKVLFNKEQTKNVLISRFLLIIFTASSFIATICCILMSPHFPDTTGDLMDVDEDDVFD